MTPESAPTDDLPPRLAWFAVWRWKPWKRAVLIALAILAALPAVFSLVRAAREL